MPRHAFVIMPFGVKAIDERKGDPANPGTLEIDFNEVYEKLLSPALKKVDCDVRKADTDSVAGDIRTQVLFELVTADIVLADVSIPNPNVFYELGIRHGARPRGAFLVTGQWTASRPFDIAPDRAFAYDGRLFAKDGDEKGAHATNQEDRGKTADWTEKLEHEVNRLAAVLNDALRDDNQVESSPVYAQLPGLKPVDWSNIQTSRAKYFGGLQDDWMNWVRLAQVQGYPGHILTLAEDAPTPLHEERILFEAATALVNLGRDSAAADILEDLLDLCPDHDEAQLLLGLVLRKLELIEKAELHMRRMEQRHKDNPEAGAVMGHVYRDMWRLRWRAITELAGRQKKALETSQLAAAAIHSYYSAQKCHPDQYFNGFNVLILLDLLEFLRNTGIGPKSAPIEHIDYEELRAVVQFARRCTQEKAERTGDYVQQFWTLTTAAGLDLLDHNFDAAKQNLRDACNVPGATVFEYQTIKDRLELLQDLGYDRESVVEDGIRIVEETIAARTRRGCRCKRVFVFDGCALESSVECAEAFGPADLTELESQITDRVNLLGILPGDLALCGICHLSDVIFAEACRKRGARVRLLIPRRDRLPALVCEGFKKFPEWANRAYTLIHDLESNPQNGECWYQDVHLGRPPEGVEDSERNRRWIANTARMEAVEELHALLFWRAEGPDAIESAVRRAGGQVHWMRERPNSMSVPGSGELPSQKLRAQQAG